MKAYLKKLAFRLLILVILIIILPFGLELILSLSKTKREHMEWIQENNLINKMNKDKLQNKDWDSNPLWIHEGETLSEKKENIKRILIIGDSLIWGNGYDNANHIWWQQFRQQLKKKGYNNVEVIAAGSDGYSTEQEFENIIKNSDLMKQINPDLIVFGLVGNDTEFQDDYYVKLVNNEDIFFDTNNIIIKIYKKLFPFTYNSLSLLISNKFEHNEIFQKHFGVNFYDFEHTIRNGKWLERYDNKVINSLSEYMNNHLNIPYFFYATSMEKEPGLNNVLSVFDKYGINYYLAFDKNIYEKNVKINPANWHPSTALCNNFANVLLNILEEDYNYILGNKGVYEPIININDWMPYKLDVKKVNENSYNFIYPNSNDKNNFLHLPINKNYIKLNLEEPIKLKNISIKGDNVEEMEIFITKINKDLGYDDKELFSLGAKNENFYWSLDEDELITSINVSAKITNGNQSKLSITLK